MLESLRQVIVFVYKTAQYIYNYIIKSKKVEKAYRGYDFLALLKKRSQSNRFDNKRPPVKLECETSDGGAANAALQG